MLHDILHDRLYRATLIAFAIFAGALCFAPLFDVLGYEFSVSIAIMVYFAGGVFVAAILRRSPVDRTAICPGCVFEAVGILLAVPLVISVSNGMRVTNCSWGDGVAFYLLIPAVTGALLGAYGFVAAVLGPPRWIAVALWYLGGGVEIAARLRDLYLEPQTFFYSHVLGYFPGPIYDEALRADWSLAAFRLGSAALALVLLGAGLVARGRLRSVAGYALAVAAGAGFVAISAHGEDLGFASGRDRLVRELEAVHRTAHFDIRYARDPLVKKEIAAVAAAHEFHLADITAALGVGFEGRITTYVFRTAADKKTLTGSGGTNIAKPWLREVYVNAEQFPYPTLRHEIAHVVLGESARTVLRVPGRLGGLLPNVGVVEGAAVALEGEGPDLTRHQGAKVLLLENLLPDVGAIFSSSGFYRLPARRAYTAAGSFMLWVLETRGGPAFIEAYRTGDVGRACGAPLDVLVAEWKKFLGTVPLDDADRVYWAAPFKRPSIFGQTCAHEAAAARAKAADLWARHRPGAAAEAYRALCAQTCQLSDRKAIADAQVRIGASAEARAAYERLLAGSDLDPHLRADTLDALVSIAWDAGDFDAASARAVDLAAMHLDLGRRRSADLRLAAIRDPDPFVRGKMRAFYADDTDVGVRPELIREILERRPDYAPAKYLLGRHLFNRAEFALAVPPLEGAVVLPSGALEREARKLLGLCALLSGDTQKALKALAEARPGGSPAWVAHIRFLERMAASPAFSTERMHGN